MGYYSFKFKKQNKTKTQKLQMFTTEHILITLLSFNITYILLLLFIFFLKVACHSSNWGLTARRVCDFNHCNVEPCEYLIYNITKEIWNNASHNPQQRTILVGLLGLSRKIKNYNTNDHQCTQLLELKKHVKESLSLCSGNHLADYHQMAL